MKTYVIHAAISVDREPLVEELILQANAEVYPAIILLDGREGCRQSHFSAYRSTSEDVLVFEDDCEIIADDFLSPIPLFREHYDLIYLGYNSLCNSGSWGTHALWVSPRAKNCLFNWLPSYETVMPPLDLIWNHVEHTSPCESGGLRVWRPADGRRYVRQKPGLRSIITGGIRE